MPTRPPIFRPKQGQGSLDDARARAREADHHRGSFRERGYSSLWDRSSRIYRAAHPLCVGCQAIGVVKATELVDHVIPHKGDPALMWGEHNWQACCRWHHDQVKQILERKHARREISDADLKLDSAIAIAVAREQWGRGG